MSLHNDVNCYKRHSLVLAIVVLALMYELKIVDLSAEQDVSILQKHIIELASSPEEQSFDKKFFFLFGQFIEIYCYQMIPTGVSIINWPLYLKNELAFAA